MAKAYGMTIALAIISYKIADQYPNSNGCSTAGTPSDIHLGIFSF